MTKRQKIIRQIVKWMIDFVITSGEIQEVWHEVANEKAREEYESRQFLQNLEKNQDGKHNQ